MEIKDAIEVLQEMNKEITCSMSIIKGFTSYPAKTATEAMMRNNNKIRMTRYKLALQTAISHLETLWKVKEAGGVKRKAYIWDSGKHLECGENDERKSFNEALDLKDAELAGRLEGLEGIITESSLCHLCFSNVSECQEEVKSLTYIIQELILGKKEG